jgi:hypothetical protein
MLLIFLVFLSYQMSLRSEFRVVMFVAIYASKRCSVHSYLQLFVGGFMSYSLICMCLCTMVSNTYCVVCFVLFVFVLCTHCRQFLSLI